MLRMGTVKEVKTLGVDKYRVYFTGGISHFTTNSAVLRLVSGQVAYITDHGKWVVEL